MGVVYVIVNSAFENYVKIGKTTNLQQRLRSLDNTSVPLPFRCLYAVEVDDENHVEHLLHQVFADHGTRTTREFFEVDAQRVIAAMKLTGGKDVTPRVDIAEDEEGVRALEKATRKPRKSYWALISIGGGMVSLNQSNTDPRRHTSPKPYMKSSASCRVQSQYHQLCSNRQVCRRTLHL